MVKIGTGVLTTDDGYLDKTQIKGLAEQVSGLKRMGYHVAVVSSGAIGSGMGELGITKDPPRCRSYRQWRPLDKAN